MATILVVDDEPSVRRAVRRRLELSGLGVIEAGSGAEGLEVLGRGASVDAVVCDVLMPELNGVALYDAIVELEPRLRERVVFLTGLASEPAVHELIEARGVPMVSKLHDLTILVDAVRLALLRSSESPPV
ncbi:MAG TPA: response regulator [Gemmatimonadales bacterium]|nr:response regulator [Gemmatimonadales bacterium]